MTNFKKGDRVMLDPNARMNEVDNPWLMRNGYDYDTVYTVEGHLLGDMIPVKGHHLMSQRFILASEPETPKVHVPTYEDGLRDAAKIARDNGDYKTAAAILWDLLMASSEVARIVRENPDSVIHAIKALRASQGLGLKEAKDAVDAERARQGLS